MAQAFTQEDLVTSLVEGGHTLAHAITTFVRGQVDPEIKEIQRRLETIEGLMDGLSLDEQKGTMQDGRRKLTAALNDLTRTRYTLEQLATETVRRAGAVVRALGFLENASLEDLASKYGFLLKYTTDRMTTLMTRSAQLLDEAKERYQSIHADVDAVDKSLERFLTQINTIQEENSAAQNAWLKRVERSKKGWCTLTLGLNIGKCKNRRNEINKIKGQLARTKNAVMESEHLAKEVSGTLNKKLELIVNDVALIGKWAQRVDSYLADYEDNAMVFAEVFIDSATNIKETLADLVEVCQEFLSG